MSAVPQRALTVWTIVLSGVVCLGFLPTTRWIGMAIWLAILSLLAARWTTTIRPAVYQRPLALDDLPESRYRHPVVLVCGDLPRDWPAHSAIWQTPQGCWVHVENALELEQAALQLLGQRPEWGHQLAVMVSIYPQYHTDNQLLTSRLLAWRWQIGHLRKVTGYHVPMILSAQIGCAMMSDPLWHVAFPGEAVRRWHAVSLPQAKIAWDIHRGVQLLPQQVLMKSLMTWFHQHVNAVFIDERPDTLPIVPAAVLWAAGPVITGGEASSLWNAWLAHHTAMGDVSGWQPLAAERHTDIPSLPNFVFTQLPRGQGMTPRERAWRYGLAIFTLAAAAALLSSGWNNRQLVQRVSFDIAHFDRTPQDNAGTKNDATADLYNDVTLLDSWARNGVPLRMSLGLYQGERLRLPVLAALRTAHVPVITPALPAVKSLPVASVIRLDSLSLFESGSAILKAGSSALLEQAMAEVNAKPGRLIVVAGHTDSTGSHQINQSLSFKRAESVRNWIRDTGQLPESCFAVQGYGASRPVANNDTPQGRALNRRVEIRLVAQADACGIPGKTNTSSQDDGVQDTLMEK